VATIVIWLLQSFDFRFHLVDNSSTSMLAMLGTAMPRSFPRSALVTGAHPLRSLRVLPQRKPC
jgi:hypothetical protein